MYFGGFLFGVGLVSALFCADALRNMVSVPHVYCFAILSVICFTFAGGELKGKP